jgi:hypothetical protein
MSELQLKREAEAAKALIDNIRGIVEGDDDLMLDMIEAETDFLEAIDAAIMSRWQDLAYAKALTDLIGNLQARKRRLEDRASAKSQSIALAMEMADVRKLQRPSATLSLQSTAPSAIVVEEADIPAQFWKPQPPKLDKRALLAALKDGETIPGAELSNGGETVVIRGA